MKKFGWPTSKFGGEEMKSRWLERIEVTLPIMELIDEKFFGLSQFFTPKCVVFGGVVVAAVNGELFDGDVDVAVSPNEFPALISAISGSPKFVQQRNSSIDSAPYRNSNLEARVRGIANFTTFGGKKVQIISSKRESEDSFEDALEVVRGVDFSCCAIAVDIYGQIFEVIKGAYDDCVSKKLRIVRDKGELSAISLRRRLDKYTKRGFTSVEDYMPLLLELEKNQPKEEKKMLSGAALAYEIHRHIFIDRVEDHTKVVMDKGIYRRFPATETTDFMDLLYNILHELYVNMSPVVADEEIDPEIFGDEDGNGNTIFAFEPYDDNVNWKQFESEILRMLSNHTEYFN
jgi:hypothetical protein